MPYLKTVIKQQTGNHLVECTRIKQLTVQKKRNEKTETAVNFVKPKPNRSHFLLTAHP